MTNGARPATRSFAIITCTQVLHDAFFKHQTKPPLTNPGDLYYEGKEFEAKNQEHKPGHVSSDLREVGLGFFAPVVQFRSVLCRFVFVFSFCMVSWVQFASVFFFFLLSVAFIFYFRYPGVTGTLAMAMYSRHDCWHTVMHRGYLCKSSHLFWDWVCRNDPSLVQQSVLLRIIQGTLIGGLRSVKCDSDFVMFCFPLYVYMDLQQCDSTRLDWSV